MKFSQTLLFFSVFHVLLWACSGKDSSVLYPQVSPPKARIQPFEIVSKHGHKRMDNYYWLKDRTNPEVIDYLDQENAYLDTMMAHTQVMQDSLFKEMRSKIQETDTSAAYQLDGFYYYVRYEEGKEYPIHCRKRGSLGAEEEVLVDGNELGKGKAYFNFFIRVSPSHRRVAIVVDTVGRSFYTVIIKDLVSGKILPDSIPHTRGSYEWTNDNTSIVYSVPDTATLRLYQIRQHVIGTSVSQDKVLYDEQDETLSCRVQKTTSKKFLIIYSARTDAGKTHYLDATDPGIPQLVEPLTGNVDYKVDHLRGDEFVIRTNWKAKNYRLVRTSIAHPRKENWTDVIAHNDQVLIQKFQMFDEYLTVEEVENGLVKIHIINWKDGSEHYIHFDEPVYDAGIGDNPHPHTAHIRYYYESLTTPESFFEYDMNTREQVLLKQQSVLGGFHKDNYKTERVMATASDGRKIPISLVYRKDQFKKNGTNPGWITGYGAYGFSYPVGFGSNTTTLLDRGFVFAIAHVRGGQEMGGYWYDEGKLLNKKNTFTDFITCSEWLIENHYISSDKLFASGGSAGGLLMGAVVNMRPDLYRGVIASVPFVDIITTMMDEAIPLTTFEWLEWGNPAIQEQYDYMLTYSPYDNVVRKAYPHMLVTTGLQDSQVQYWEPAKWVAKLRALKTDSNVVLLQTNMAAGHGGASGRFQGLKEVALKFAFVLNILNANPSKRNDR